MPEARMPVEDADGTLKTVTAKLLVLSKKEAQQLRLRQGPNIPIEFLDNDELLDVVVDGYSLYRVDSDRQIKKGFTGKVRRLY